MTPIAWLAVVLVGVGSVSQGLAGFGLGLVAASAVIAAFGPTAGVVTVCLLALVSTVLPLRREIAHTRWVDAAIWTVTALVVTPLLGVVVRGADVRLLTVASGLVILIGVVVLGLGRSAPSLGGRAGAVLAGGVSSAMNLIGGAGAPPVALYAANAGWSVPAARATMLTFFTMSNVLTVAVLGLEASAAGASRRDGDLGGPGTLLAAWLAPRTSEPLARRLTLIVAAVGGISLILGAVL